ncbi:hypothetical protein D3C80_2097330 [compost metagenome]
MEAFVVAVGVVVVELYGLVALVKENSGDVGVVAGPVGAKKLFRLCKSNNGT